MKRRIIRSDSSSATVEICKNFHDEREWRYVPNPDVLTALNTASIIANPHIIPLANEISKGLEQETYRKLWLDFSYDDIRYIIVPNIHARIDIIKTINDLPDNCFDKEDDIPILKQAITLHTANLLINALVKDIQKSDDGTVQILYGDTDSKPMYISFSAFETVEEAKHEENTILQHDEIYVNALTSNAYINQYYEE